VLCGEVEDAVGERFSIQNHDSERRRRVCPHRCKWESDDTASSPVSLELVGRALRYIH
ncbi:hypothetical protein A2U01_0085580, partial [Trifolium medium]|nr:hypothetical protein [Trifolium medium]